MKITRKLRDEAARLASVLACDTYEFGQWWTPYGGHSKEAYALWGRAFDYVVDQLGEFDHDSMKYEASAEAESLLRCGWTPEGWEG